MEKAKKKGSKNAVHEKAEERAKGQGRKQEICKICAAGGLNHRSEPGRRAERLQIIPGGVEVIILENHNAWGRVVYRGVEGWIDLAHVRMVEQ